MTISFYSPLEGDSKGRFKAMWANFSGCMDFFFKFTYSKILFQTTKYITLRKIDL